MREDVKGSAVNPTMALTSITGDWQLDQELLAIARIAVRILVEQRPKYEDYRTVKEADDA